MTLFEELIEDRQENKKIVKSFKSKDSLSPDIFNRDGESFVMHDDVRKQLLHISNDFLDTLGVEFFVHDIILTGSLSNFNWSEYSDIDLHILLDMDEFGEENKNEILLRTIFKEFFDTKKDYWNLKHNIKIKNFDVEIYVQDLKEPHVSSGVYSIVQNKWLIEPERLTPNIDDRQIIEKGEEIENKIENLLKHPKDKNVIKEIDCLRDKIKKFRKCGLEKGGEFSYENLVFKLLRRNGSIDKLLNFKRKILDNNLSLKENNQKLFLHETPDTIDGKNEINFKGADAIPFGIYEDIMMVGFSRKFIPQDLFDMISAHYIEPNKKILEVRARQMFSHYYPYSTHPEIPPFYQILYELGKEKEKIYFDLTEDFWRTMFVFPGRIWINSKIISFWEYPNGKSQLIKVLNLLSDKLKSIYDLNINLYDFEIEIKVAENGQTLTKLIPLKDYASGYLSATKKEMETPHTLPPEEKIKHPQMVAAKQSNIEILGKKEKGWDSLSQRNFILKKDIAEKKNNIGYNK